MSIGELNMEEAQVPKSAPWTPSVTAIELHIMPKRLSAKEQDSWLGHCGWCNRQIGEEGERIAINARFRDKKDYRKNEGRVVSFALADAGRMVVAFVVTRDSPAKKQNKEVVFQVCSDRCGLELTSAMSKEMNMLS
jgi:hypothetical protein